MTDYQVDNAELEMAIFSRELAHHKLQEIDALEHDRKQFDSINNPAMRAAAETVFGEQLIIFSTQLGEIALTVDVNLITAERIAIEATNATIGEARTERGSLIAYGAALSEIVPSAAADIKSKLEVVLSDTPKDAWDAIPQDQIDAREHARLVYQAEAALDIPITSLSVEKQLLAFFDEQPTGALVESNYLEGQTSIPSDESIRRQLIQQAPLERIREYFTAFVGYPIVTSEFGAIAYAYDTGKTAKQKQNSFNLAVNPKLYLEGPLHRDLQEKGITIQHGWLYSPNDSGPSRRRIIRSVRIDDYNAAERNYVGYAYVGAERYVWESVEPAQLGAKA